MKPSVRVRHFQSSRHDRNRSPRHMKIGQLRAYFLRSLDENRFFNSPLVSLLLVALLAALLVALLAAPDVLVVELLLDPQAARTRATRHRAAAVAHRGRTVAIIFSSSVWSPGQNMGWIAARAVRQASRSPSVG